MASFGGVVSARGSSSSLFMKKDPRKKRNQSRLFKINCVSTFSADPYKTLRINKGASESEVKKAFRQLALQVNDLFNHKKFVERLSNLLLCSCIYLQLRYFFDDIFGSLILVFSLVDILNIYNYKYIFW